MRFTVPTRIILGKKKKTSFPINANTFANKHHRQKHNAKMMFYEHVKSLGLKDAIHYRPFAVPIRIHMKYYRERGGTWDMDNAGFGIHKFTADALAELKIIHDDNYKLVKWPTFEYMGIDKTDHWPDKPHLKGRCDIIIEELL